MVRKLDVLAIQRKRAHDSPEGAWEYAKALDDSGRTNGDQEHPEGAAHWRRIAAKGGFPEAQLGIAQHVLFESDAATEDRDEAKNWLESLKLNKNAEAIVLLGRLLLRDGDEARALELFESAAALGNRDALLYAAHCCLTDDAPHDVKRGYDYLIAFRDSGRQGLRDESWSPFHIMLARCFMRGDGVIQDKAEGFRLYREAAKGRNSLAKVLVGHCYLQGAGVEKNFEEAAKSFSLAADEGDPYGQFELARCFEEGIGVEQSWEKAKEYYLAADAQGYIGATERLLVTDRGQHGSPVDPQDHGDDEGTPFESSASWSPTPWGYDQGSGGTAVLPRGKVDFEPFLERPHLNEVKQKDVDKALRTVVAARAEQIEVAIAQLDEASFPALRRMADKAKFAEMKKRVFGDDEPSLEGVCQYVQRIREESRDVTSLAYKQVATKNLNFWKSQLGLEFYINDHPCTLTAKSTPNGRGRFALLASGAMKQGIIVPGLKGEFPPIEIRLASASR